jgi:putative transcriptional regulator
MIFIETTIFTRLVQELLPDEEYREQQSALIREPNSGPVIQGSRGLRKLRWALPGRGRLMDEKMFAELESSLKEGMAIIRGEVQPSRTFQFESPDVKAIRENLKLSQQQFSALLGISIRTLQNWEQGRRTPEGPARVLLLVAAKKPQALLDVVGSRFSSDLD